MGRRGAGQGHGQLEGEGGEGGGGEGGAFHAPFSLFHHSEKLKCNNSFDVFGKRIIKIIVNLSSLQKLFSHGEKFPNF